MKYAGHISRKINNIAPELDTIRPQKECKEVQKEDGSMRYKHTQAQHVKRCKGQKPLGADRGGYAQRWKIYSTNIILQFVNSNSGPGMQITSFPTWSNECRFFYKIKLSTYSHSVTWVLKNIFTIFYNNNLYM